MASSLNYTTLSQGWGRSCYWSSQFLTLQGTTLLGATTGTAAELIAEYPTAITASTYNTCNGWANSVSGWVSGLIQLSTAQLASLQQALNAPSSSPSVILPLMYADMQAQGTPQSFKANTIGTPTIAAASGNTGNGLLLASTLNYLGIADQRILNEEVAFVCTSDQYSGTAAGAEVFRVTGYPATTNVYSSATLGNGNGPSMRVADSQNLLTNGNFSAYPTPAYVPTGWTLAHGTAGTNVAQETVNIHSGSSAVKLIGDGTTTQIELTQAINGYVSTNTVYGVSIWLRKAGTVTSGSTFAITITGTGISTQTVHTGDPSALTTSYQNFHLFFVQPATIPSNLMINLNWTSANTAGASAIIDIADCVLISPTNFGFVNYMIVRGSTDFLRTDSFTSTTTNDNGGAFSTFFGRYYGALVPVSGSPTISDTLATGA